jgi:anti-sigma factor RsiW
MTDDTTYSNREIADLLPWYESGRLAPAERQRVEAALVTDAALRRELVLVREEMAETIVFNESQGVPSRQAADRFFAALDASPRRTGFNLMRFVVDRLDALRPQTLAWGATAALALVILQAGVISHLVSDRGAAPQPTLYESASVPASAPDGAVLLVAFTPTATAAAIQKLLEDNGLSIVGGPAAGFYSLRVGGQGPAPKMDEIMARLNGHKDIVLSAMRQSPPE